MKRFVGLLIAAMFLCLPYMDAAAAELTDTADELSETAEELTAAVIECDGRGSVLTDGSETTYTTISAGGSVTVISEEEISSLYIIFDRIYGEWTLSDGMSDVVCGKDLFLHEYIDLEEAFGYLPTSLTLTFPGDDCNLSELHLFGSGKVPSWVQQWEPPCEEADLVLFSTHIDDEQLFFAGILPYYAGECGYAVQVVYFTDPFTYHDRPHEQLNGLWTVGVRHYPVSGVYIDAFSESAKDAYADQQKHGYEREGMVRFQAEMIRRFRPHVIVGHDIDGEYGHGQHIINCETLMEALELAADESYDLGSVQEYGVWDTPKTYIHLWKEQEIVMDWDVPLEAFDGKTAFQVSQEGFLCHESQQWTWFRRWMLGSAEEITKAAEIKTYSPCLYGLYRTKVGLDAAGGDMFEHIPQSYAEMAEEERQRQEEAERARLAEKAEAERLRLPEQEAKETAPALRQETESAAEAVRETEEDQESIKSWMLSVIGIIPLVIVLLLLAGSKIKRLRSLK